MIKIPYITLIAFAVFSAASLQAQAISDLFITGPDGYTAGSANLVGQDPTVTGWTGPWLSAVNDGNVNSIGLNYPGLLTSGGSISTDGNARFGRALATGYDSTTTGTVYLAVLLQVEDNIGNYRSFEVHNGTIDDPTRAFHISVSEAGTSNYTLRAQNDDTKLIDMGAGDNAVNLFVLKIEFSDVAGGDSITVWRNPTDITSEAGSAADGTLNGLDIEFDITSLARFNSGGGIRMDELRLGSTWEDVVVVNPVFVPVAYDFEAPNYSVAPLDGQNGWVTPAAASIASKTIEYTYPNGDLFIGGAQAIEFAGAIDAEVSDYAVSPALTSDAPASTFYVSYFAQVPENNSDAKKSEFFIQNANANWQLYSSIKADEDIFEINGATMPYTFVGDEVYQVVLKMTVDAGLVTQVDAWVNPAEGDEAAPLLTSSGLSVSVENLAPFRVRSQRSVSYADHLLMVENWSDVFVGLPPFSGIAEDFEDLSVGDLNGQEGWTAPAGVSVANQALEYTYPNGDIFYGGSQAVELAGATGAEISAYAVSPAITTSQALPESTFYISYFAQVPENNNDASKSEFFIQNANANWQLYSAIKADDDIFEINGANMPYTFVGDEVYQVVLKMTVDAGVVTQVDAWVNPAAGDEGTPLLTSSGLSVSVENLAPFRVRSQRSTSYVDHLLMVENWSDAFVGVGPFSGIAEDFESFSAGALEGQNGWTAPAGVSVANQAIQYTYPNGDVFYGGSKSVELGGAVGAEISAYAVSPAITMNQALPESTFYISYFAQVPENNDTSNKSEFFIQNANANWQLYSAIKADDDIFEINGANTPYTFVGDEVYQVVLKMTVDAGIVTQVDAWVNPAAGDEGTPLLTSSGLSVSVENLAPFRVRSQRSTSYVDHLLMVENWSDAFVGVGPFTGIAEDFESFSTGALEGQNGWTAPAGVSVADQTLIYTYPNGDVFYGDAQAVELAGASDAEIKNYAVSPALTATSQPPQSTYYVSYFAQVPENNNDASKSEFFIQHASANWQLYSSIKPDDGIFEINGANMPYTFVGDEVYQIVMKMTVDAGLVTQVDAWVNPDEGDEGTPLLTSSGLSVSVDTLAPFRIRSQRSVSYVDHLLMVENWGDVFVGQPFPTLVFPTATYDTTSEIWNDAWLGDFYPTLTDAGEFYIYTWDHGFWKIGVFDDINGIYEVYDFNLDKWVYIDSFVYPYLYIYSDVVPGGWVYFEVVDGEAQFTGVSNGAVYTYSHF